MKRNVMMRAHQIAKSLEGDYHARMSLALRKAWKEERNMKMLENLKNMSVEELESLRTKINEELEARKPKKEYAVYSHDCMNTANYHKNKYKHWAKLVTSIDTTKANG